MSQPEAPTLNAHVDEQVAHDLNNLLGVILNYATLLRRTVDDPRALADLDEIRSAAERAALLTRQMVTFASGAAAVPDALDG